MKQMLESNLVDTMEDALQRILFDIEVARTLNRKGRKLKDVINELGMEILAMGRYEEEGHYELVHASFRKIAGIALDHVQSHAYIGVTFTVGETIPIYQPESNG